MVDAMVVRSAFLMVEKWEHWVARLADLSVAVRVVTTAVARAGWMV
jgi:hypothetical protein